MDESHEEPPRPPLEPLASEETGCVSGMVLIVAVLCFFALVVLWFVRKFF
jgi:hypothetical protein